MRLSEAIRAGAEIRPQCKDVFYNLLDGVVCSCALGAAFEGAGLIKTSELNTRPVSVNINLCAYFDGLEKYSAVETTMLPIPCPVRYCQERPQQISEIICHLNDDHAWSRELIADWLESIQL